MTDQTLKTTGHKRRKKTTQPRYVLLWENIQSLQAKLLSHEATNKSILQQFSSEIRPLEESLAQELIGLTKYLINGFHQETSVANRSLLGFWVIENFVTLAAHPFSNSTEIEDLYDEWRLPIQGTEDMIEAQLSLLMAGRNDLPGQSNLRSNYPDSDMFATSSPANSAQSNNRTARETANDQRSNQLNSSERSKNSGKQSSQQNANKTKPKTSSNTKSNCEERAVENRTNNFEELFNIDKLFRRIARIVHPDREQDETKKAEKHAIMSDCLQARENEDIAQLLTLYTNHVGELPDTWSSESTEELESALEKQLRDLEIRSAALHCQDPVLQMILDRYLGHDANDIDRQIQVHRDNLTAEIERIKLQRTSLSSEEGWANALEKRRDIELDKLAVAELTQ